jgi:hypothetical protein
LVSESQYGFSDGSSFLNNLEIGDGQRVILHLVAPEPAAIQVKGHFSMHNSTLTSGGDSLIVHSMDVTNSVIESTQLIVDGDGSSTMTLNNSTFQGFPTDAGQLAILHPGGVFSFSNNTFQSLLAGDLGYYLVAEDTNSSDGVPLQITIGFDPGNGAEFTSTTGAIVTWVP